METLGGRLGELQQIGVRCALTSKHDVVLEEVRGQVMKANNQTFCQSREPSLSWHRETLDEELTELCVFIFFEEVVATHGYVKNGHVIGRVQIVIEW